MRFSLFSILPRAAEVSLRVLQWRIRWWLFKSLSNIGWWICPEPSKGHLQDIWAQRFSRLKEIAQQMETEAKRKR